MLDLAILGLLEENELHGYEIRKQLRETLGMLANVSFGSLYPALNRLEKAGAVLGVETPTSLDLTPTPPTGSLTGELAVMRSRRQAGWQTNRQASSRGRRSRKVYRITDKGRSMFTELLHGAGAADDARIFGLRLAFARYLPPQARMALLERRKAQLLERQSEIQATNKSSALDVYAKSVIEHSAEGVRQDICWLERLIDAERASAQIPQAANGMRVVSPIPAVPEELNH